MSIHLETDLVPDRGHELPLVDEARTIAREQHRRRHERRRPSLDVHVETNFAAGGQGRGPPPFRSAGYRGTRLLRVGRANERRHAHVRGNGKSGAKFWLEPMVEMASPGRYNENELKQISRIIRENLATMTQKWDDECARVQAEGAAR